MQILLSYMRLVGFGGTETYTFTVAQELERLGHDVAIYAPETGAMADFVRSHGVRVIEQRSGLPSSCDAVIAQDANTAHTMAASYPYAVRLYVAHSIGHPLQSPPQIEGICDAVVVLNDYMAGRVEALAWHPEIVRLRQPIDLQRFCLRAQGLEQRRPPRVLAMSNNVLGTRARIVEEACNGAGLTLTRAGSPSWPTATPEQAIAEAEIVISLGRGILEAMASGRAAYVFGEAGGDGWVTSKTYEAMESGGFAGRALGRSIDADQMARDLAEWNEQLGEVGRGFVCANHAGQRHAGALVDTVRRLGGSSPMPVKPSEELARLVRLEWDSFARAQAAINETMHVRAENVQLRRELAASQSEFNILNSSRRYRLACRLARPLDRLKAWRASRAARRAAPDR